MATSQSPARICGIQCDKPRTFNPAAASECVSQHRPCSDSGSNPDAFSRFSNRDLRVGQNRSGRDARHNRQGPMRACPARASAPAGPHRPHRKPRIGSGRRRRPSLTSRIPTCRWRVQTAPTPAAPPRHTHQLYRFPIKAGIPHERPRRAASADSRARASAASPAGHPEPSTGASPRRRETRIRGLGVAGPGQLAEPGRAIRARAQGSRAGPAGSVRVRSVRVRSVRVVQPPTRARRRGHGGGRRCCCCYGGGGGGGGRGRRGPAGRREIGRARSARGGGDGWGGGLPPSVPPSVRLSTLSL